MIRVEATLFRVAVTVVTVARTEETGLESGGVEHLLGLRTKNFDL